ncbi:glycosyltransferase family 4 protein [Humibacter antri]
MRRPRVLLLDHTASEGGAEVALLRLGEMLQSCGAFELRVLLFADGPMVSRISAAGIPTAVLRLADDVAAASRERLLAGGVRPAISALRFPLRLARAIRGSQADLVVANSLKSAGFAFLAAPLAGRRWVWHLHDRLADDYLPTPLKLAMRLIAVLGPCAIVTNSAATLETLPSLARRKAVIAYPGLPAEAFAEASETPATPVVGIVGRVSPTKGQREFLYAAERVAPHYEHVRFAVIGGALFGEDDYEVELRSLAERLGIADRVEFTGWVSDAPARIRGLALLVHASPVPEPFGQVIVEAMAAGVPVVATAAGGVPEILDGRRRAEGPWSTTPLGVLVRPGDVSSLAEAIVSVLGDPRAADARAEAARADSALRFTIAETARVVSGAWNGALPGRVRVR